MEGGGAPFSSAMAPSSSYILIIVSQPVSEVDKENILERLNRGLLSWDVESTGCDLNGLEAVCAGISPKHLDDTDVLIQHSTESLGVEVLVNPTVSTLKQCVRNLLSTSTGHKHLIHAGYTFAGSGSWILQNGTFAFDDFLEIFQQADVQSQKRCNINIHCLEVGRWNSTSFSKDIFASVANVAFNPSEKVQQVPGSEHLINCLRKVLTSQDLEEMMESSSLVGNIRFNRPTLYMFPAGQGDCALFGINGFNMLIDGGFNRKPCSWEFIRHLDRLDAVLVTRLCENNVCGMSTLMKRKSLNNTYPQIGYVFCNIPENKTPSPKEETPQDKLIVSVVNEGNNFIRTLNELKLEPHQCWRDSSADPFVLYHKVGHGTLEMHVLSPPKDSKEMKEFISEWRSFKETFSTTKSGLKSAVPLSHATSICAVLIWRPTDPKDTITRILFPGSAPQNKIFESLEKLKTLDVLSHPVVTKASLSVTKSVSNKVEKSVSKTTIPNRKSTASPALSVNSVASRNGDIHKTDSKDTKKITNNIVKKEVKREIKKEVIPKEKKEIKSEVAKKEIKKDTPTDAKKEVKKIVKKEVKDLKSATEKKIETKTATKKETTASPKPITEVKKTSTTTVKKSTVAKKEVKPAVAKTTETKKPSPAKTADLKTTKDAASKKVSETKSVAKTKPKSASPASKTAAPKTKPVAVPKPGGKMTKAVAASTVVASAVAVTAAAFELNEKKEDIVVDETEAVVPEPHEPELAIEPKELEIAEKPEEDVVVSPLPPEAVSPTPSESVSLTPSDTLSSAPLETVSPTPPLANEPISTEEKEVNEIKDIEQDMPYEAEITDEIADEEPAREETSDFELEKEPDAANNVANQLAQLQQNNDAMSTSFVGANDYDEPEIEKIETTVTKSAPFETGDFKANEATAESFGMEDKPHQKEEGYIFEAHEASVDDQLAQMSMEGSFCAEVKESSVDDQLAQMTMEGSYSAHNKEASVDDQLAQMTMEGSYCADVKESSVDDQLAQMTMEGSYCEVKETSVDDKLAQMSMEGSYCAGNYADDDEKLETEETEKIVRDSEGKFETNQETIQSIQDTEYEKNYEQGGVESAPGTIIESDNYLKNKTLEEEYSSSLAKDDLQGDQKYIDDYESKESTEVQEKDIEPISGLEYGSSAPQKDVDEHSLDEQYDQQPELEALKESISRSANEDYELSRNIINDADMQETSVDEPEEINRKESVVSITLNDEELDDNYTNEIRRKSGTESEDDVDLQQYMMKKEKDNYDNEKLNPRQELNSDDEDVVKSPTPHTVIDYEDNMENLITGQKEAESHNKVVEKELYPSEKEDFDEKDHDSTEDQDIDDGEMIRHPTPPEMKYSEDDMRDPIGPHFITNPSMKSGTDITEQPLYEEAEDDRSDRSESPVVEQPVFGNVGGADFPELVTVSGGTTPSEPQSPKAGLDGKKFGSDAGLMEALSEHDLSESSTHSPLVQDNTAFDLPVTIDKPEIETHADDKYDENKYDKDVADEEVKKVEAPVLDKHQLSPLSPRKVCDAQSDDESYSQNEKSETRSEKSDDDDEKSSQRHDDKSDMHDDRSDNQYDGKSDIHDDRSDNQYDNRSDVHDDRSDNQYDAKSDVMDDERKSDIHDDDRYDYHHDDYYEENKSGSHHEMLVSEKHDSYAYETSSGVQKSTIPCEESGFHSHIEAESKPQIVDDQFASHVIQDKDLHLQTTDESSYHVQEELEATGESDLVYQMQEKPHGAYEEDNKCYVPSDFQDDVGLPIHDLNAYSQETHSNVYDTSENFETKHAGYEQREIESSVPVTSYEFEETSKIADVKDFASTSQEYSSDKHEVSSNITDTVEDNEYNRENLERMDDDHKFNLHQETEVPHPLTDMPSSGISYHETEEITELSSNVTDNDYYNEYNRENLERMVDDHKFALHQESEIPLPSSGISYQAAAEIHHYEDSRIQEDADDFHAKQLPQASAMSNEYEIHSQMLEKSNYDDSNYNYMSEEQSFTMSQNYETASKVDSTYERNVDQTFSGDIDQAGPMTRTDFENDRTDLDGMKPPAVTEFDDHHGLSSDFGHEKADYQNVHQELHANETETGYPKETMNSEVAYSNSGISPQLSSTGLESSVNVNGKEQTSYSHSEQYSEQYASQTMSNMQDTAYSQQESSYIISSRFHSDSPEDNVMRSDSSPDVPYPPSAIGAKNSRVVASEEFMQTKEGYNNMNFQQSDDMPASPNKKTHNANRDDPYDESSEEDDSSSVPGTVSPYAYTNKAYAKEEEDIDGNHIYKESAFEKRSEILKQMEFDPNNPQSLTTQQVGYSQDYEEREYTGSTNYDFKLEEWEKPMGLPTPPDATKTVTKKPPAKSLGKSIDSNGKAYSPTTASKMSSPLKKPKPKSTKESSGNPVYVDLAYVPHHGDPHYCDVEFFKKIRARYYVFSGINPSKEVLNALLEAKKTWKEEMEVTIIPTYETDTLGYWMAQNQDDLATYSIEVAPSASRCTVNLQDHETSCAAYRLEF